MRHVLTITRRELGSLFGSPVPYIVLVVFCTLVSWLFTTGLFLEGSASMRGFLTTMPFIILFVLPAIAMRSFAEERRSGTLDLLLTLPVRDWQLVVGKYLALLVFWALALALTLNLPITLIALGEPDGGQIVAGYLAVFLLGSAVLALGMASSVLTENQIVAFILGVAVTFVLLMFGESFVLDALGPTIGNVLERLSLRAHFDAMAKGVLDLRDVYYFLALIGVALSFVMTVLESRKWR